ncbi:hypothetical protein ACSQ67_000573 [Phaseolus vulgaris]
MQFIYAVKFCLAAISKHNFKWREHHVSWIIKPVIYPSSLSLYCVSKLKLVNLYSSSIPFFRLEKEILDRYLDVVLKGNKDGLKKLRLRIDDPPHRKHMVYLGGAVLAGIMKDTPGSWISRENYQEEGIAVFSNFRQA